MEKIFFVIDDRVIYYNQFFDDLSNIKYIPHNIKESDPYLIFLYLISSIIYNCKITLLDFDFSIDEIANLGIGEHEISSGYHIEENITVNSNNFRNLLQRESNWTVKLFTSGTTGKPKAVEHNINSLLRDVRISASKSNDIWGLTYNPTHIAGLLVFFQAIMNFNTIIYLFKKNKVEIIEFIKKYNITNISATPTFYRLLLPLDEKFFFVKRITFGGERFDPNLVMKLKSSFPNAKILNIYASTEAGSLFTAAGESFQLKDKYRFLVKILDGEILIHKSLLSKFDHDLFEETWYRTGDLVEVISDDPLVINFIGRRSEFINVGGYKVNPAEVEAVINRFPDVVSSRVYGRKNSVTGTILVADVFVHKDVQEHELRKFLQSELQEFKIPRIINFTNTLNLTRSVKLRRSGL